MSALSRSAKIQITGCVGGAVSFVILFIGLLATGGGHGSYTLWYAGLVAVALSALMLIAGTIGAASKTKEKKGLIYGLSAIVAFAAVAVYFFDIVQWLADILFP